MTLTNTQALHAIIVHVLMQSQTNWTQLFKTLSLSSQFVNHISTLKTDTLFIVS